MTSTLMVQDDLHTRLAVIRIEMLQESPDNPRKHFDEAALAQLAESIEEHGVLTPLRVREMPTGPHLIAAGHRRYRAAHRAGKAQLPVLIGPMTDEQFLEILTVDNLQRDDLHPLEEARGFALLMERIGYDIGRLAARIGKSKDYVYDSVRLLKLTKPAQQLFEQGKIFKAHAVILSRLSPSEQARTIGKPESSNIGGGLFERSHIDRTPEQATLDKELGVIHGIKARTPKELQTWIDRHVRLDPKSADLPELFPDTSVAITGAVLGEVKVVQITYDYVAAHDAKDPKVRTFGSASWKRADGRLGSKHCPHAVLGVVVAGAGRGTSLQVCIDKKKCGVHWRAEKAAATRAKNAKASGSKKGGGKPSWQIEQERQAARRKLQEEESKRWKKAGPAILAAFEEAISLAASGPGTAIAGLVLEACENYRSRPKKGAPVKAYLSSDEILRACARNLVLRELSNDWVLEREAPILLKPFGLDPLAIVNRVAPKEPAKPTVAPAKPAKKGGAKSAKAPASSTPAKPQPLTEQQLNDDYSCEGCGCTVDDACEGGCSWDMKFAKAGRAVCSSCVTEVVPIAEDSWELTGGWMEAAPAAEPIAPKAPTTKPKKALAGDKRRADAKKRKAGAR